MLGGSELFNSSHPPSVLIQGELTVELGNLGFSLPTKFMTL